MSKKFLALVGSPRPASTSSHLAQYLLDGLAARGWQTQALVACAAVRQPEKWPDLEAAFREADAVAIVTPLYVDCVPAELTAALERLVEARRGRSGRLCAVVNCGFVEAHQNDVALEIYRLFARDAGLHWAGGLAIGGGGMFGGKPLTEQGGKARHVIAAFDQAIAALDAGQDIPESATTGIRKLGIPTWVYVGMANLNIHIAAAKHGNLLKIGARPYRPCP
jgi:multimeric flavodoxin WrbA